MATVVSRIRRLLFEDSLADYGWKAALSYKGKVVFTGNSHFNCWVQFAKKVMKLDGQQAMNWAYNVDDVIGIEDGFQGPDGTFYDRQEALAEWRKGFGDQIKRVDDDDDDEDEYATSDDIYEIEIDA